MHRRRAGWSQRELADRCGVSVRTIRNLERGIGRPRHDSVRLVAEAFDLTEPEYVQLTGQALDFQAAVAAPGKQLPSEVPDFTGRSAEIAAVTAALERGPVVMLAGKPGVGKTALALHLAHLVSERFPGGQLHVDLRGAGSDALDPDTVLHRFLRALGVDASAIPADSDERAAAYRAALAGRRVLVVLDDAGSVAQVWPLLPGTAGCAMIVTGRTRLAGLAGVDVIDVDVPDQDEAVELLAEVAGRDRVSAEPEAARGIVERCGRLPLAVRVAGARLAGRRHWPLHRLLSLLDDERGRLDQLAAGDLEVRASLAVSYRALPEPARRAFRLLGSVPVGDFAPWLLAPLLDLTVADAERLVDRLVDACLLDTVTRPGADRYRLHELVRVYAVECAAEEDASVRKRAFMRVTGCWLALAEGADERLPTTSDVVTIGSTQRWRLPPEDTERILADPLGWFDLERDNLVAAVRAAAAADAAEPAWELAGTLIAWILLCSDTAAYDQVYGPAAAACRRTGNLRGEAAMAVVDHVHTIMGEPSGTDRDLLWALAVFRRLDDARGEAAALLMLGSKAIFGRDPEVVYRYGRQALQLSRRACERGRELSAWQLVGRSCEALGRLSEAAAAYEESLVLARALGAVENEAHTLWRLGQSALAEGRPGHAVELLEQALALARRIGNRTGEASVLATLSEALLQSGRLTEARARVDEMAAASGRTDGRFDSTRVTELLGRLSGAATDAERA
jgi:transcriptional regulator with XRE-family HTH domain/tetratricopeptide (TPR) repeat protein